MLARIAIEIAVIIVVYLIGYKIGIKHASEVWANFCIDMFDYAKDCPDEFKKLWDSNSKKY